MKYSIDTEKYIPRMLQACKINNVMIDLKEPKTIQDKLAWLNIYDVNPLKCICADKIKLHDYSRLILDKDICIPIIRTYDKAEEINFDELPNQFVLKCNHGSGMNIIVKDKSELNKEEAIKKLNKWMSTDFAFQNGFEAHYHDINRKCFVEEYKEVDDKSPFDYKISCFNGKPMLIQVFGDRFNNNRHMNYYDVNFNYVKLSRRDFVNRPDIKHERPKQLEVMLKYSEQLSKLFKFVRVDFYEIDGRIYLGEMTFVPGACLFRYATREDEIKVGNLLEL